MRSSNRNLFHIYVALIALFCAALITSCTRKADVPSPTEQVPEFEVRCLIGNDSIKLKAGINDYFLATNYSKDSSGIYVLSGELKKQNCSNCTEILKISISDDTTRAAGGIANIAKVLATGNYNYASNSSISQPSNSIQFFANATGVSYLWDFGDGGTTSAINPTHHFPSGGQYQVCLAIKKDTTHNTTVCNNIIVDDTKKCSIEFNAQTNGNVATFTATTGHQQYHWNFGDFSGIQTTSSPTITHTYGGGIYRVAVSETDTNGCNLTFTRDVPISGPDTSGSAYTYTIQPGSNTSIPNFSKATIEWTDKNGKKYSSLKAAGNQPTQSFFTITSSTPYKADAKGNSTYKISATLRAILYNVSNPLDSLMISSNKIKIAVAYP